MKFIVYVLLLITIAQLTNAENIRMRNILIVTRSTKGSTAEIGYKMKKNTGDFRDWNKIKEWTILLLDIQ